MFTTTAIALAIVVGISSGALAATRQRSSIPSWEAYDCRGVYVGSDPDPRIRADMLRDYGIE